MTEDNPTQESPHPKKDMNRLVHDPWLVVGVLFLMTGALGIPLIWLCRAFSVPMKLFLTVSVTLYSAVLLWAGWLFLVWAYQRILVAAM